MKTILKQLLKFVPYAVFVALASRIALTRQFPLPFDENFHFGIINFYAHHLNPFFSQQPTGTDSLGALARDPSYLYQYLLSFPMRALLAIHATIYQQILFMRALNIGFEVTSLYLVVRLARQFGLSRLVGYSAALGLAVTPVFIDTSAQINYDNLLIPLSLLTILLTSQIATQVQAGRVRPQRVLQLCSLLLLTSLVIYSFLPIMLAVVIYLGVILWRARSYRLLRNFAVDARTMRRGTQIALISLVVLSSGLWLQRYGINIVRYHTPHPQCNAVLSVQQCMSYGPWARNYTMHQATLLQPVILGPRVITHFTHVWLQIMWRELYSFVSLGKGQVVWTTQALAMLAGKIAIVGSLLCLVLVGKSWRRVSQTWLLASTISALYMLVLWGQNFSDFHNMGQVVAVSARYLLPILPLGYLAIAGLWSTGVSNSVQAADHYAHDLLPVIMTAGLRLRNELFLPRALPLRALLSSSTHKPYTLFLR